MTDEENYIEQLWIERISRLGEAINERIVESDLDFMRKKVNSLMSSNNTEVIFLDNQNNLLRLKIQDLESKIINLEKRNLDLAKRNAILNM